MSAVAENEAVAAAAGSATGPSDTATVVKVTVADDPLVEVYRDLKNHKLESRRGIFIAEGPETIKMLLRSEQMVQSLFLKPSIHAKLEEEIQIRRKREDLPSVDVFVAPKAVMSECVGFNTRGSLAAGPVPRELTYEELRARVLPDSRASWRVLAIDGSTDDSNVGSLVRTSAALGVHAVLLSHDCAPRWSRKAVRVSMGHVFRLPTYQCSAEFPLPALLSRLSREAGLSSFAAVIDADAPSLEVMPRGKLSARWCVVVGSEHFGVSAAVRDACRESCGGFGVKAKGGGGGGGGEAVAAAVAAVKAAGGGEGTTPSAETASRLGVTTSPAYRAGSVRIEMAEGVDSLAITCAAAVVLNGMREREERVTKSEFCAGPLVA